MCQALSSVQVNIPLWALVHLPVVVTVTTAVFTPGVRAAAPAAPAAHAAHAAPGCLGVPAMTGK